MPELVPVWERLAALVADHVGDRGDAELAARMLCLYRPPRFLPGCSQAVWTRGRPMLVRNYDYDPALFEGTVLRSAWGGTPVMATSDCLWGALDGINAEGLTLALAFGGRPDLGDGFGITLILRYVLEVCSSVEDAVSVLRRVPSHMAYNVSLLDRSGAHAVAYLRPGRPLKLARGAVCTNHQPGSARSDYSRATQSRRRRRVLREALRKETESANELVDLFLRPPLYVTDYERGYGTLYTVVYRPDTSQSEFRWRDLFLQQSVDRFVERDVVVALGVG